MWFRTSNTQGLIKAKLAEREKALLLAPSYVETAHDVYLKATASEIVTRIQKGEWTASEVLEAYIARAAFCSHLTNCVTEVLFGQARTQATDLDKEFASTGQIRGPLHGVPVSFKDLFEIQGVDASIGFTQWANKPSTQDSDLVAQFRAAGAIPFVKTNVPQTMLSFECRNPLWGCTTNPWNDKYTCGGSSGGEGAILSMDGSVIGLGSDIGGSLRIPASYCGIYSLKPGVGRISSYGTKNPTPGFESIRAVVGPMTRSVSDLELVCRTVFGMQGVNQESAPLRYRDVTLPGKLKFGYYTSDGVVKASPTCRRAVLEAVEALRKDGHECIEFEMNFAVRAFHLFVAFVAADGYKQLLSHLGPDPKDKSLFLSTLGPRLPWVIRNLAAWAAETFFHDDIFAQSMRESRAKSFGEIMQYTARRNELIQEWYQEVWEKNRFDGIIAPVQAMPVLPHGGCTTLSPLACATSLYNIIDSPVGCIPVTRVDPEKDQSTEEWFTGTGHGSLLLEAELFKGKNPVYNPEEMKGIPVGVQIIGKKWEDEKVLSMMHVIDRALGPRGFGPMTWRDRKEK